MRLLLILCLTASGWLSSGCRKRTPVNPGAESGPVLVPVPPPDDSPPPSPVVTPERAAVIQSVNLVPLRAAILKYQQQFKQNPYTLPDLQRTGLIKQLPPLPPGTYIQYDRSTATVKVVAQ